MNKPANKISRNEKKFIQLIKATHIFFKKLKQIISEFQQNFVDPNILINISPQRVSIAFFSINVENVAAPYQLSSKQTAMRGFTLTEMLVAVAILGILSGIAIPSFISNIHKTNTIILNKIQCTD